MTDLYNYEEDDSFPEYEPDRHAYGDCGMSCPLWCDGSGHLDPFDTNEEARGER